MVRMIREEIIKYLDKQVEKYSLYYQLKSCIEYTNCVQHDGRNTDTLIDDWFKGVIDSLYYRPNHFALVLKGNNQGDFFRDLLPEPIPRLIAGCTNIKYLSVYTPLIIEYEFEKTTLDIVMQDNFDVLYQSGFDTLPSAVKRLSSYCSITNTWPYPPRKSFIILDVVDINQELYNSIDKYLLWIEIFNKFKPKGK